MADGQPPVAGYAADPNYSADQYGQQQYAADPNAQYAQQQPQYAADPNAQYAADPNAQYAQQQQPQYAAQPPAAPAPDASADAGAAQQQQQQRPARRASVQMRAEMAKQSCFTWPRRALLAGCLGGAMLGWFIALGEEADTAFDNWWYGMSVAAQIVIMGVAELKLEYRRHLLTLALGVYFGAVPLLLAVASAADEQELSGLATGYVFSFMAGGIAWIAFAPPVSTSVAALKEQKAAVLLSTVNILGMVILWGQKEALPLSIVGGSLSFLFLTATCNDKTPLTAWITQFVAAISWLAAGAVSVEADEGGTVAGAFFIAVGSVLISLWTGKKLMWAEGEKPNMSVASLQTPVGYGLLAALLVCLIGAPLSCTVPDGAEVSKTQQWYAAMGFFLPLVVLAAANSPQGGGLRAWLMLWAAAWVFVLSLNFLLLGVLFAQINEALPDGADGYDSAVAGYAFLLIGCWGAFLALRWVLPVDVKSTLLARETRPEKLRLAALGTQFLGVLLGIFAQMADNSVSAVSTWGSLLAHAFFVAASLPQAPPATLWVAALWMSFWQFSVMNALRNDDGFDAFALFLQWISAALLALVSVAFLQPVSAAGDKATPGGAAPAPAPPAYAQDPYAQADPYAQQQQQQQYPAATAQDPYAGQNPQYAASAPPVAQAYPQGAAVPVGQPIPSMGTTGGGEVV